MEILTEDELKALRARLPRLSEAEWKEIEKMAYRLREKFMQDPTIELRNQLQASDTPESFLEFFRNIFRV
ncbi:glutamyl-tRNA reductase [compost metagenome]